MSRTTKHQAGHVTKWITFTAMFMALNIVMSSFGVPVPVSYTHLDVYKRQPNGRPVGNKAGQVIFGCAQIKIRRHIPVKQAAR